MAAANRMAVGACRLVLYTLLVFQAFLFILFTVVRWMRVFTDSNGANAAFQNSCLNWAYRGAAPATTQPLSPSFVEQMLAWWLMPLGVALCTIGLAALPKPTAPRPAAPWQILLKRIAFHQLPPRRFWAWWCGGMHVLDACLVLFYLFGIVFTSVYEYSQNQITKGLANNAKNAAEGKPVNELLEIQLDAVSLGFGFTSLTAIALLFYPLPRSGFLQTLFNTSFAALNKYHRWIGHSAFWMVLMHGLLMYSLWFYEGTFVEEAFEWSYNGVNNLAGSLALVGELLVWFTALEFFRRRWYRLFYRCHIFGVMMFMGFGIIHYTGVWNYMGAGLTLYLLDVAFRVAQSSNVATVHRATLSSDNTVATVELLCHKSLKCKAGDTTYVNFPSVSKTEWHPFSVSSVSTDARTAAGCHLISFHIKNNGYWTQESFRQLAQYGARLPIRMNGPYGALQHTWPKYDVVVMVVGGIGITPVLGMLRDMHREHTRMAKLTDKDTEAQPYCRVPSKVYLIWSARHKGELAILDQELVNAACTQGWLTIQLHYTGKGKDDVYLMEPGLRQAAVGKDPSIQTCPTPALLQAQRYGPWGILPGLIQPYNGSGLLSWATMHVTSLFCSFMVILLVYSYIRLGGVMVDRPSTWSGAIVLPFALLIGAMGIPTLLIMSGHWVRQSKEDQRGAAATAIVKRIPTPVDSVTADNRVGSVELSSSLQASTKRPDLDRIFADVVAKHAQEREIAVYAAGPAALRYAVMTKCANQPWSGPYLDVYHATHDL